MAASRSVLTPHHAEPPAMPRKHAPNVPLPKHWKKHVKSAILQ